MNSIETWVNKLSNRELNFLTFILTRYDYPLILPANKNIIIDNIEDMRHKNYREANDIESILKARIVDSDLFSWLKGDNRALLWMHGFYNERSRPLGIPKNRTQASPNLLENLMYNIDASYHLENPSDFNTWDRTFWGNSYHGILLIDFDFCLQSKIDYLNSAKNTYIERKTDRKSLIWIDKNNEEQIYWAVDYLKDNDLLLKIRGFSAYTNDDLYNLICASLDAIDNNVETSFRKQYTQSARKQLIISKMRKAWSQKKFRDKKDAESAQEYFLTRRHMNKLKKLADEYGLSSKEYLQQLIDEAYNSIE